MAWLRKLILNAAKRNPPETEYMVLVVELQRSNLTASSEHINQHIGDLRITENVRSRPANSIFKEDWHSNSVGANGVYHCTCTKVQVDRGGRGPSILGMPLTHHLGQTGCSSPYASPLRTGC